MSLENLIKINQLQRHTATADEVQRLLAAANRNMADSGVAGLSDETRFDAAYKAIMQCAMLGLMANGYRPSTTTPGHHQTMIQTLGLTMGIGKEVWIVLDSLRKKRNLNDYSGDLIEPAAVRNCISHAQSLLTHTYQWLSEHRPDLLNKSQ
ncbi:MAG: DNA-binding protein [Rhodoferax sp.]|jgi:hypothetical protein|uniref:DNA-binding protein n=1 Tax=Rhodoferax sp. TaxID=50421 RepID=UPI001B407E16|nr:DNA-binding protein [Rhodoferax sp.]MBP9147812.1 DNA-binding protein [Rhodoferax sp.]MBP9734948.1 DNA-binding protein [Rhodoferax sp.]